MYPPVCVQACSVWFRFTARHHHDDAEQERAGRDRIGRDAGADLLGCDAARQYLSQHGDAMLSIWQGYALLHVQDTLTHGVAVQLQF